MEYIDMGQDVKFSRIIQGFWRLNGGMPGTWGVNTPELVKMIEQRLEVGVTTLDTAAIYGLGECEVALGEALKSFNRKDYQIVTKAGIEIDSERGRGYYNTTYNGIIESCNKSLDKLGCDYLDMFLIHREDPMINHHEAARALGDLKKQGLVKEIGVSNFDPFKFNALNKATGGELRTNQIELNPTCFEHFNSGMIDVLQVEKINPMVWSPLAGGKILTSDDEMYAKTRAVCEELAKKYGVSASTIVYAWILNHPVGCLPIVGSSKVERLQEAIDALDLKLDITDWYYLYTASGQQILR